MKIYPEPSAVKRINLFLPRPGVREALTKKAYEEWIEASAQAHCIVSDKAHLETELLHPWFPSIPSGFPSEHEIRNAGGVRAIRERIAKGDLGLDASDFGVWTPDFLHGLRMAGAIKPESQWQIHRWQIWIPNHRELLEDLGSAKFPHTLVTYKGTPKISRLARCPLMLHPPTKPNEPSLVAGLLAGGMYVNKDGETWMTLPRSLAVRNTLETWSIPAIEQAVAPGRYCLLVSPFFSALFSYLMPSHLADRALHVQKPALCPLLAAIYFDLALTKEGLPILPFSEALPFGCSIRQFRRNGWHRPELFKQALQMGITGVATPLKQVVARWYTEASKARFPAKQNDIYLVDVPDQSISLFGWDMPWAEHPLHRKSQTMIFS